MTLKSILTSAIFLASLQAWPAVTSFSVDGNTVSAIDQTDKSNVILYAGFTGAKGDCQTPSNTSVCNACSGLTSVCGGSPTVKACAERSIHPDLYFSVDVAFGTIPTSPKIMIQWTGNGSTATDITSTSGAIISNNSPGANEAVNIKIQWRQLCNAAGMGTTCTNSTGNTGKLQIGIVENSASSVSTDNTQTFTVNISYVDPATATLVTPTVPPATSASGDPFTAFQVVPGDGKVYVKDAYRGSTGPSGGAGLKWSALRIFYAPADNSNSPTFCNIPLNGSNYADLTLSDVTTTDASFTDNKVSGLENDVVYMFTGASVDQATIVQGFIDPSGLSALTDKTPYIAQPGEVVGLLDGKKCFIATAAFGSQMAPQVEMLRQFRNRFLLSNEWGKNFVRWYYKNSPPAADFIAHHNTLRAFVRGLLWPLVLFADLALEYGFFAALLGLVVLVSVLVWVSRRIRRTA